MSINSDSIGQVRSSSCTHFLGCCDISNFNKTITKVTLFILGIGFVGAGIYGACLLPKMWGSYFAMGVGLLFVLTTAVLTCSKKKGEIHSLPPHVSELPPLHKTVARPTKAGVTKLREKPGAPSNPKPAATRAQRPNREPAQTPPNVQNGPFNPFYRSTSVELKIIRAKKGPHFHIFDLFTPPEYWKIPAADSLTSLFPLSAVAPCPENVLDCFEQLAAPILRVKEGEDAPSIIIRYSIYTKEGEWVEDSVIRLIEMDKGWAILASPLKLDDYFFLLSVSSLSESLQTEWLQNLVKGAKVPLKSFVFGSVKPAENYFCTLWKGENLPLITQIFGTQTYPEFNFSTINSNDLYFYRKIDQLAGYAQAPITQGKMKNGEPFFLVGFEGNFGKNVQVTQNITVPISLFDKGYLLIWQDVLHGNEWKIHVNLLRAERCNLVPTLSSELLKNLEEGEVEQIKNLVKNRQVSVGLSKFILSTT